MSVKKIALTFLAAVFVPSLALAWLAVALIKDQEIVFERQQMLLYEDVCSRLAGDVREIIARAQADFAQHVESLLADGDPLELAEHFDERLVGSWPTAEVGFVVTADGSVLAPSLLSRPEAKRFRVENDLFLSNQEKVYWPAAKMSEPPGKGGLPTPSKDGKTSRTGEKAAMAANDETPARVAPRAGAKETEFRQLIGEADRGVLPRFLQNRLKLLLWHRSPLSGDLIFGAQLKLAALQQHFESALTSSLVPREHICVALLDDNGLPVARSHPVFRGDWGRPFVSVEIGSVLPHWQLAAYLLSPDRLEHGRRSLTLTLSLLVAVLLAAIAAGSWLIVADLKRQLTIARQKTDFVSNVSHELKSPLTSIRMFSDLLVENRVTDEAKRMQYLKIISGEAARLTRLINNVLDFARIERGEKQYRSDTLDMVEIVRETVEAYRPHLEAHGFVVTCALPQQPAQVRGDRDALAQVLINLLSNAEKYSDQTKEARVEAALTSDDPPEIRVNVLDRGVGVPPGCEEKIFEEFFRAHDSLSSGVQGSGLGLTLARRIARAHGGDVRFYPRPGGGSHFELRLPCLKGERADTNA